MHRDTHVYPSQHFWKRLRTGVRLYPCVPGCQAGITLYIHIHMYIQQGVSLTLKGQSSAYPTGWALAWQSRHPSGRRHPQTQHTPAVTSDNCQHADLAPCTCKQDLYGVEIDLLTQSLHHAQAMIVHMKRCIGTRGGALHCAGPS